MPVHDERLTVPLWWWPVGLTAAALLAAEIHLGYRGLRSWVPYVVVLPLTGALLWWLGRVRVWVTADELHVDDAHLPLRHVAAVDLLDPAAKRAELGPRLDPLAFVVHRPWVPTAVRVVLDDPDDPTPYWIMSSRRPGELIAALSAARA